MRGATLRARSELRARLRAWVVIGVLVGLAGGAATAAAAAARRTSSAYPRFLVAQRAMDVLADVRNRDFAVADGVSIRAFPSVADATEVVGVFNARGRTEDGRILMFPDAYFVTSGDGRFGSEINATSVLRGRPPDAERAGEVSVGFTVAARFGLEPGGAIQLELFAGEPGAPGSEKAARTVDLRIVGIHAMPGEFQPAAGANIRTIHMTPAFYEANADLIPPEAVWAIRLRQGAGLADLLREANERGLQIQPFFRQSVQTQSVTRSTGLQSVVLWLMSLLTALGTGAILGQAVARQAFLEAADYPTLRALGMTRRGIVASGLARPAVIAGIGVVVAIGVAVAASPLAPIGLARIAEPSPGLAADWVAFGAGAAVVVLLVLGVSLAAQWRAAVLAGRAGRRSQSLRRSLTAERLARAGGPVTAVAGVRLALEPGRGSTSVPVRSTIAGTALGVAGLAAALTLGAGIEHLAASPALSGWPFDLAVAGPRAETQAIVDALRDDGLVVSTAPGGVEGAIVAGIEAIDALLVIDGAENLSIAAGRAPATADEIALGRSTMSAAGLKIGDTVGLSLMLEGDGSARQEAPPEGAAGRGPGGQYVTRELTMRVVGRMVMPELGFNLAGAGDGGAITTGGHARFGLPPDNDYSAFMRVAPGVDPAVALERVREFGPFYAVSRRDSQAVSRVSGVAGAPLLLAGILMLISGATLTHTLVTSVRRRARDLALLRTIGFVRRQVLATVAWQSATLVLVALALGLPIGVATGRWAWLAFADSLGVVAVVVVPSATLALAGASAIAGAVLVSAWPGMSAARARPAKALRANSVGAE